MSNARMNALFSLAQGAFSYRCSRRQERHRVALAQTGAAPAGGANLAGGFEQAPLDRFPLAVS